MVAFLGVKKSDFEWTGATTGRYKSSPGVTRHFCETCGTPMAFEAQHYAGEIHLYAASLSDPTTFEPKFHVYYDEKLPWLHVSDNLPKYPGSKTE